MLPLAELTFATKQKRKWCYVDWSHRESCLSKHLSSKLIKTRQLHSLARLSSCPLVSRLQAPLLLWDSSVTFDNHSEMPRVHWDWSAGQTCLIYKHHLALCSEWDFSEWTTLWWHGMFLCFLFLKSLKCMAIVPNCFDLWSLQNNINNRSSRDMFTDGEKLNHSVECGWAFV